MEEVVAQPSAVEVFFSGASRKWQQLLDKSTVYVYGRWIFFASALLVYLLRVYYLDGWFIVTYGLGIFLLNMFIGFLSPQVDPDNDPSLPTLPTAYGNGGNEEFRPFSRKVPEFKFWYSSSRAVVICFFMTFFSIFNVPVFWPILLLYFIVLFCLTMKRQIKHMWKHNYVPWSGGKQQYGGKGAASAKNSK